MKSHLKLQRPARRRVEEFDRRITCPDQRIRCRVVLKVSAGRSCKAAARGLGCAPSTAVRIVARSRAMGEAALSALSDHRDENGQRKIDADVRGGVCEILSGTPQDHGFTRPTWTLEIIRMVVEQVCWECCCRWAACGRCCMDSACAGDGPGRSSPVRGGHAVGSGGSQRCGVWLLQRARTTSWSTPTRSTSI